MRFESVKWPVYNGMHCDGDIKSVYLLKTMSKTYKIGISANVFNRVWNDSRSAIQDACPTLIIPLIEYRTVYARLIEQKLHNYFSTLNKVFYNGTGCTEWFEITSFDFISFLSICEDTEREILKSNHIKKYFQRPVHIYDCQASLDKDNYINCDESHFYDYMNKEAFSRALELSMHPFFTGKS